MQGACDRPSLVLAPFTMDGSLAPHGSLLGQEEPPTDPDGSSGAADHLAMVPLEPVVNVALVDDHTLMRSGLAGTVNAMAGYRVVLEAGDGEEFTTAIASAPPLDIAVIDLRMPRMDGFETIAWMQLHHPQVKCIALTFDSTEEAIIRAMRSGARGYLLKNTHPHLFKSALDAVRDTGYFEADLVRKAIIAHGDTKSPFERQRASALAGITLREMEIIKLIASAEELTYEQIASRLGIEPCTIETHRKHLFERLNIKSKSGLVIFAIKWGIVKVEAL